MDYYLQRVGLSTISPAAIIVPDQQQQRRHSEQKEQEQQRAARMATAHLYKLQQGMIKGEPGQTPSPAVNYRCERCGI